MVDKVYTHSETLTVSVPFTYADLTTAVAEAAAQLPSNAKVVGGDVTITTAFNYGTSGVIDVGDSVDDDRYSATPINLNVAARTALTLTGYETTAPTDILITPTLVGVVSAGAGTLTILYVDTTRGTYVSR